MANDQDPKTGQASSLESEGEDVSTEVDLGPHSELTVGLSFLEKLVLAIIRAHPLTDDDDSRTDDQRLRAAMFALRGEYYRHGKKDVDDRLLLLWMAAQWLRREQRLGVLKAGPALFNETDAAVEFESLTELARAALKRFKVVLSSTEDAALRRLSKAFEKQREMLIGSVMVASPNPHLIEHSILLRVIADLQRVGVRAIAPDKASAF